MVWDLVNQRNTYSAGHLLDDSEQELDVLVGADGSLGRHGE